MKDSEIHVIRFLPKPTRDINVADIGDTGVVPRTPRHPLNGLGDGSAEVLQKEPTHVHPELVGPRVHPRHVPRRGIWDRVIGHFGK